MKTNNRKQAGQDDPGNTAVNQATEKLLASLGLEGQLAKTAGDLDPEERLRMASKLERWARQLRFSAGKHFDTRRYLPPGALALLTEGDLTPRPGNTDPTCCERPGEHLSN